MEVVVSFSFSLIPNPISDNLVERFYISTPEIPNRFLTYKTTEWSWGKLRKSFCRKDVPEIQSQRQCVFINKGSILWMPILLNLFHNQDKNDFFSLLVKFINDNILFSFIYNFVHWIFYFLINIESKNVYKIINIHLYAYITYIYTYIYTILNCSPIKVRNKLLLNDGLH